MSEYNVNKLEGTKLHMADCPFPLRHPARVGLVGVTHCGKSSWMERYIDDLPNLLDTRPTGGVFYAHPAGDQLGTIRKDHIQALKTSCAKFEVPFAEVKENILDFIEGLKRNDLPRVIILDDIQDELFHSPIGANFFNMTGELQY
jgi:hypothetical protein